MQWRSGPRFLAAAVCLALAAGCGRHGGSDDDHPLPPLDTTVAFFDDFSGPFPDPNWNVFDGFPYTDDTEGNGAPALTLEPLGDPILMVSDFVFGADQVLTVSFDLATLVIQSDSNFQFNIVSVDTGTLDAAYAMFPFDDEIVLRILNDVQVFEFPPATTFDIIEFTVDSHGVAAWWINGAPVMSRPGFPTDFYEMEIVATGGDATVFLVDNVLLTRP